ncbi:hypothetical protein CP532_3954 [Ophiocordyceps camponoti-leonardi (nom. inval.)]|nr:hypothetical protein CP532_3954 [Ophiocordyceps camponoti-leonardi (nom. inval.)]
MVTTPDLSIAKATLTASLLRADPQSLNRAAVNEFLELLNSTLDQCSRPNVKKCKDWILGNVVPSKGRASTLGKYLVALAESMEKDFDRPSVRRRRLHALYIANDVLHHTVVGRGDQHLVEAWEAHLPPMIATASTFEKCPKHLAKIRALIDLWETKRYVSADLANRLRESFARASDPESGTRIQMTQAALELAKEAPYIMPAMHGDPSLPWHEQPASLWLAQLRPGVRESIRPSLVRPVQLNSGPASEALIKAVKDTLEDAETLYSKDSLRDRANVDFNPLGERLDQRPQTYWGWSPQFCRRVKEGKHYVSKAAADGRRSRSRPRRRSLRRLVPRGAVTGAAARPVITIAVEVEAVAGELSPARVGSIDAALMVVMATKKDATAAACRRRAAVETRPTAAAVAPVHDEAEPTVVAPTRDPSLIVPRPAHRFCVRSLRARSAP